MMFDHPTLPLAITKIRVQLSFLKVQILVCLLFVITGLTG